MTARTEGHVSLHIRSCPQRHSGHFVVPFDTCGIHEDTASANTLIGEIEIAQHVSECPVYETTRRVMVLTYFGPETGHMTCKYRPAIQDRKSVV